MLWRMIAGVILGDVIFAGGAALLFYLSRVDPHAPAEPRFVVFSVIIGIVLAFAGGFVAGWIAAREDLIAGILLTVIIAAGALASLISRPGQGAVWSQVTALLLMSPSALAGDWLRLSAARKR